MFQCEDGGIVGFRCILIGKQIIGRQIVIIMLIKRIIANQFDFLYDTEIACFDGVAAIGMLFHIGEDGGNLLWLLCILGGEKLTADSF